MAAIPMNPLAQQAAAASNPQSLTIGGMLTARPLSAVLEDEKRAAMDTQNQPVVMNLVSHIRQCWTSARDARMTMIEKRMQESVRARRGEYEPDKAAAIREQGGSDVYAMLTSVKCRAAASWMRDVLMGQGGERPWSIRPTRVPELPPDAQEAIIQAAAQPIMQAELAGVPMPDEAIKQMMSQMYDAMHTEIRMQAQKRADRMADKMEDQLSEGGWRTALDQFLDDLTTFPAAILKGPVIRMKPVLEWVQDQNGAWTSQVKQDLKLEWERVDPFRFYPAPHASDINDGYMIEHHRLSRSALNELIGVDGYDEQAIKMVLDEFGKGGLREWMTNEVSKASAEGRSTINLYNSPDGMIDALQFWGSVQGKWLVEWGMEETEIPDLTAEYDVEAWLIGNYVIKAVLNADPLRRKPYYKACYEEIPGTFWGNSVADLVKDTQTVVNTAARQLVNNMGIASGPQVGINVSRLADGEDITQIFPWKIWQFQDDITGSNGSPIHFFSPDSHIAELMNVFEKFSQLADEYSGIPRYMSGENPGSLGRTASGLSMLINNASKSIKQVISNIDTNVMQPMLERLYFYNMQYSEDPDLKGDVAVVARGAASILAKEAAQVRRNEFLTSTMNPVDMQIVGVPGRAAVLREVAKSLDMEVDRVVPPDDVIQARMMAQQQAMMAAGPPQEGGPSQSGQELPDGKPVTDHHSPPKQPNP